MTDNEKEAYEERAAILEYEAGLPRERAESMAKRLMLQQNAKKNKKSEKSACI